MLLLFISVVLKRLRNHTHSGQIGYWVGTIGGGKISVKSVGKSIIYDD